MKITRVNNVAKWYSVIMVMLASFLIVLKIAYHWVGLYVISSSVDAKVRILEKLYSGEYVNNIEDASRIPHFLEALAKMIHMEERTVNAQLEHDIVIYILVLSLIWLLRMRSGFVMKYKRAIHGNKFLKWTLCVAIAAILLIKAYYHHNSCENYIQINDAVAVIQAERGLEENKKNIHCCDELCNWNRLKDNILINHRNMRNQKMSNFIVLILVIASLVYCNRLADSGPSQEKSVSGSRSGA